MGLRNNKKSDFQDLHARLHASDPPPGMPSHISQKLAMYGLDLAAQRLYFSPNAKGDVEWFERDGSTTIRMTPSRSDIVSGKFSHAFDQAFGKENWKITLKSCSA